MANLHKRALVLSGGGGRGAYHVGVYKYLEEKGLLPDVVIGTSIGAVNGAMIVSGLSAADMEREWLALTADQIHRIRLNPLEFIKEPCLLDTDPWKETLERQISFHKVRTSKIVFRVAATEVGKGKLKLFRGEEITVKHILASCSIPVVYPWTEIDGARYWDGAVVANTPLAPAIDEGADDIYAVLLSPVGARELPLPESLPESAAQALDLALLSSFESDHKQLEKVNARVREGRDRHNHHEVRLHVIAPSEEISAAWILTYNAKQAAHLIELGYNDAKKLLESQQA
ncbi:MAG: patatin-like phospholipase family protein [Chloroflexi bacterium]|nr:MAG: patatin-like phospholipase family protein [Chloroflexota bacterium]